MIMGKNETPHIPVFEVVTLALCPKSHLDRFCGHYIDQGASRVRVFHDGLTDLSFADPRIELTSCDDPFWQRLGIARPFSVEARQRAVFAHAYAQCHADWCLVVDVDEQVFGPQPLDSYLASIGPQPSCVRFLTAEAVFAPQDDPDREFGAGAFRLPVPKYAAPFLSALLYRELAGLFVRGMLGHARGKQAIRAGLGPIDIGIHDVFDPSEDFIRFDASTADNFWLAHYDAISFPLWQDKCRQRIERQDALEIGRKRERQLDLFSRCAGVGQQRRLFQRLYGLSNWQIAILRRLGLIKQQRPVLWEGPDYPVRQTAPANSA